MSDRSQGSCTSSISKVPPYFSWTSSRRPRDRIEPPSLTEKRESTTSRFALTKIRVFAFPPIFGFRIARSSPSSPDPGIQGKPRGDEIPDRVHRPEVIQDDILRLKLDSEL